MSRSLPNRALHAIFSKVNQRRQWYELPTTSLKTLNLLSLRLDLRDLNLFDTGTPIRKHGLEEPPEEALTARRPDGKWNDLEDAEMGSTGTAFTRNINPKRIKPEKPPRLYDPSPRKFSLELMTRDEFKPAETLNVLAQAWIQFENHNWFFHGRGKPEEVLEIPVEEGDDWPDHPMRVRRTVAVPSHSSGVGKSGNGNGSIDYGNTETHWWDGSQIYGSDQETQNAIRTFKDGKLKIGADGRLLPDQGEDGLDLTGFNENYWFGCRACTRCSPRSTTRSATCSRRRTRAWSDQRLFDTAWLINAALMAKIHTVEWTPGIVNTLALWFAMNANWSGIFGQNLKDRFGRLGDSEILSGIMGSPQEHHDARFQLTEEFISVYRMHPLLRDDWNIFSAQNGELLHQDEFVNLQGAKTRSFMDNFQVGDMIYSMGVENPGAITLHNYPEGTAAVHADRRRADGSGHTGRPP